MTRYAALLDACVLVNPCLRDTLLRLAEAGLFLPRWSERILQETAGALQARPFSLAPTAVDHLLCELRVHFPEAWVTGYERLQLSATNHPKDRHVVAAAVHCGAKAVVTFNVRHFPPPALDPWGVVARHPDDFLIDQYRLAPDLVTETLCEQAIGISRTLPALLTVVAKATPNFAKLIASHSDERIG